MTTSITYRLDPGSEGVYADHKGRARRLLSGVNKALGQGANETAAHLQRNYLVGGDPSSPRRGRTPLANRSGALARAVDGVLVGTWEAVVGAIHDAPRYARSILGKGTTTITPKSANHLWIPIADNRTKSGLTRMSPREAMEKRGPRGGRLLSIFKSKRGNLVAFLREAKGRSRLITRGKNKGRQRGLLLFVLKKSVEVQGTDALAKAVEDKRPRVQSLIQAAAIVALAGQGGTG